MARSQQQPQLSEEQALKMDQMLEKAESMKCKCGSTIFTGANKLKRLSRILTGEAQDIIVPIPAVICVKCREELKDEEPAKNENVIELDFRNKK